MVSEEDFNYVVDNLYSMLQTCYDRCIGNCGCGKEYDRSVAIVKDMYSTIERVRELHKPTMFYMFDTEVCVLCTIIKQNVRHSFEYVEYPCATIKALDGEIGSANTVKTVALEGEQG